MNLKESFRYQHFLELMLHSAVRSVHDPSHAFKTTKTHLRSKANPDAEDITEEVTTETPFFPNDDVIGFMEWLVEERRTLSEAIGRAKASIGFDLDAAIDTNKFRQGMSTGIKSMLNNHASKTVTQGRDYRFDVNGIQSPYFYAVEVVNEEAFDRAASKDVMRRMLAEADKVSAEIDEAMINTTVDYTPVFDVNDSFEDVMAAFIAEN